MVTLLDNLWTSIVTWNELRLLTFLIRLAHMVSTRSQLQSITRSQRRYTPVPLREQFVSLETSEFLVALRKQKRRRYLLALKRRRIEASRSSYAYQLQGDEYYTRYYYPEAYTDEEEDTDFYD